MNNNTTILRHFFDRIWNTGDVTDVPQFIAPGYTIHSDPGDSWDGQTLTLYQFCERMVTSRPPFPDLTFSVHTMIDGGDCVVASWATSGTHQAPLGYFPATGRTINIHCMTIYYVSDGWLAVLQQLGILGE